MRSKNNTPRKRTAKKTTQLKGKATKGEPFTSASSVVEEIEQAAGDIGRIAHAFFFSSNEWPPFIRNSVELKIKEAATRLNLPNPYETDDDATAFQQLIDIFKAAGDELLLEPSLDSDELQDRGGEE